MRTVTIVPTFKGDSAYFDLPDIGFQGDHLSFAILFNLTELVEHWPNILPSMIITDPKGNTYIAPHTHWNAENHIFTWSISNTETTYDGYLMCQLKCISADDPETIVCMSRICQTRVYQSLATAENPPEAFQSWLDALVQLGAEINADAAIAIQSMETTENNARAAQAAADEAELAKNAAQQARAGMEQIASAAVSARDAAVQAQQRASNAANTAEIARDEAVAAKEASEYALEEADKDAAKAERAAAAAEDHATQAGTFVASANDARLAAEAARDSALAARGGAEAAQRKAETAEEGALTAQSGAQRAQSEAEAAQAASETAQRASETAQRLSENAQHASETAQAASEAAQQASEDARDRAIDARDGVEHYADQARRWAEGKTYTGQDVDPSDITYENNAEYWAHKANADGEYWTDKSEEYASSMFNYLLDVERRTVIIKTIAFSIRPGDWIEDGAPTYPLYADIPDDSITTEQVPMIVLSEDSLEIASDIGICTTIRSSDQRVRLRAMLLPDRMVTGIIYLVGVSKVIPLAVRPENWKEESFGRYSYYTDIRNESITSDRAPLIVLDENSLRVATNAGLGTTIRSFEGYIRIRSVNLPEEDLTGSLYLIGEGDNSSEPGQQQSTDPDIASDIDVQEMISDVFEP